MSFSTKDQEEKNLENVKKARSCVPFLQEKEEKGKSKIKRKKKYVF